MVDALQAQVIGEGMPFLGICLGMQLMMDRSLEGTPTEGLGWIMGDVRRLEPDPGTRVPHVGWETVRRERPSPLFDNIPMQADFYFVHSYVVHPVAEREIVGRTPFGSDMIVTAVQRDNCYGVQFHPEKSQRVGLKVISNFLQL